MDFVGKSAPAHSQNMQARAPNTRIAPLAGADLGGLVGWVIAGRRTLRVSHARTYAMALQFHKYSSSSSCAEQQRHRRQQKALWEDWHTVKGYLHNTTYARTQEQHSRTQTPLTQRAAHKASVYTHANAQTLLRCEFLAIPKSGRRRCLRLWSGYS